MKVLCATDLLPKSEAAIDRAGLLAERLDADLSLLHVAPLGESGGAVEHDVQHLFARLTSRARPPLWRRGPQPNVIVRRGSPARCVIEEAGQLRANLIVLGPHRSRGVCDAAEDTTVARILGARCSPVLIAQREPQSGYQNVLLALDLSPVSAAAIRAAESLICQSASNIDQQPASNIDQGFSWFPALSSSLIGSRRRGV